MISTVSFLQKDDLYRFLPPIKWSLPFPTSNQMISTVPFSNQTISIVSILQSAYLCRFLPPIRKSLSILPPVSLSLYRFNPPIRWSLLFPFSNQMISIVSILQSDKLQLLSLTDPYPCRLPSADILLFSCSNLMIVGFVVLQSGDIFKLLPIKFFPSFLLQVSIFFFAQLPLRRFVCLETAIPRALFLLKNCYFYPYLFRLIHPTIDSFLSLFCKFSVIIFLQFLQIWSAQYYFFVRFRLKIRCLNPSISECNHSYDRRCYKSLTTVYEPTQVNLLDYSHIALP
jgi:hypothetical protein